MSAAEGQSSRGGINLKACGARSLVNRRKRLWKSRSPPMSHRRPGITSGGTSFCCLQALGYLARTLCGSPLGPWPGGHENQQEVSRAVIWACILWYYSYTSIIVLSDT